jgi:hypothetical protein
MSPETFTTRALESFQDRLSWMAVAQELHSEDSEEEGAVPTHLHVILIFRNDKKYRDRGTDRLNSLCKQGDYKPIGAGKKNLSKVMKYVAKEQPNGPSETFNLWGITWSDYQKMMEDGSTKSSLKIWERLTKDKWSMKQLLLDPECGPAALLRTRNLQHALTYLATVEPKYNYSSPFHGERAFDTLPAPEHLALNEHEIQIATWLDKNIGVKDRPIRTPQLLITGPGGIGKSSLMQRLTKCCRIYYLRTEDFYCGWDDDNFDLCILDEYNFGALPFTQLNQWLSGAPKDWRTKGGHVHKKFNVPTIVLSNTHPLEWYPKISARPDGLINTLISRFEIVQVQHETGTLHRLFDKYWEQQATPRGESDDEMSES